MRFTQDQRHKIARIMAHGGWWGATAVLAAHISMGGSPPAGHAPPWLGLVVVILIGVGIAAGQSLGRMRLTDAITKAFDVGYDVSQRDQMDEVRVRQTQILNELEEARADRLNLVRDLQKEIANHGHHG